MQASVDTVEYRPASHAVHVVALDSDNVSVTDPAAQLSQVGEPSALANRPRTQSSQSVASPAASEKRPGAQRSQPNVAAALSLTNQPGPQAPGETQRRLTFEVGSRR